MHVNHFASTDEMNAAVRDTLTEALVLDTGCDHAIMLSGGNTPLAAYRAVAGSGIAASPNAHVLFSDERMVPPNSPESNFGNTVLMLKAVGLPEHRILRVRTELPLPDAARAFDTDIDAFFVRGGCVRLGLLGLGSDGHTASLFSLQDASRTDCWALPVPKDSGPDRVSVTARLLRKIERIIFVVAGRDKTEIIHQFIDAPESIPAGRAVEGARHLELWLA